MKKVLLSLCVFSFFFLILEISINSIVKNENFEKVRTALLGETVLENEMRLSTIPYLTYIPTPNYLINGHVEHNKDGYRGERLELKKASNEFRILFLGGSTTYGYGVSSYKDTYPHKLTETLNSKFVDAKFTYINGGIPYGTSAELLVHYLFKYKYYSPDLIIINTGGNDADAYTFNNYQPDYNNWRMLPGYLPTPNAFGRTLLQFKSLAYIYIYIC